MAARYELLKQSELDLPPPRPLPSSSIRRYGVAFLLLATLGISAFYVLPSVHRGSTPAESAAAHDHDTEPLKQCAPGLPLAASPHAPLNPWASLTIAETTNISAWLLDPAQVLNLTRADVSTITDNVIFHIGAWRPAKADALAYLDAPQAVAAPERFARVTIQHGGFADPVIRDYLVGPLPVGSDTKMSQLTDVYHRPDIPYNARGIIDMREVSTLLAQTMLPLAEITQDLFGGQVRGLPNDTLVGNMAGPYSFDGSFRRGWVSWRRAVPGPWVHPVNFFLYIDVTGTDRSKWSLLKVVYNHQVFSSMDAFVDAYKNGTLRRIPKRPDQDPAHTDYSWSTRKRPANAVERDLDDLPGPRSVSFAGLRFRVDRARQYISYLGWSFYLGFDRDMGLSLWDIRFRGERIVYELAPQEAVAQYAGNDPFQTSTSFLDRYFGMGTAVRDLLPGYDCPHEAIYLPATSYTALGTLVRSRAICVFEMDSNRPISRHTGYAEGEFGAVKGYVLTVRSISTVGNYDYLFDYMFQVDGTIEVRLSASGYLQGGYWEAQQTGYGTAIRETTMGSLHDHMINYKVDLDVAGLRNSLLRTTTAREEVEQPWFDDDWGSTVIQQKISREIITNEDDALLKYPPNFQGHYSFVNQEESNKWGSPRGYAIHPGYSPIHNTIVGSKRLLDNANWARYNLAVSRRKETEPTSSSMWNMNIPGAPTVDFHKFFDGENITQQDIVAWVNVGMHHLPQAEDSPNTRTNLAASSFYVTPMNYFDSDVSMESRNAILLQHPIEAGGAFTYDDYGVRPVDCVPERVAPFEYGGLEAFGLDGARAPPASTENLRKEAELFHRIKIEL